MGNVSTRPVIGFLLLVLTAAGCGNGPYVQVGGPPIAVTATTPRLPMAADGLVSVPVAAFRGGILVSSRAGGGSGSQDIYQVWDPASGTITAIADAPAASGDSERVIGSWDGWVLTTMFPPSIGDTYSFKLRNLATDEVRSITMGANPGSLQLGDGWVVWTLYAPAAEEIHAYSVATGRAVTIQLPPEFNTAGRLGIDGDRLAWIQVKDGQPAHIVTRNLANGATTETPLPASLHGFVAVSGDGRYVAGLTSNDTRTLGIDVFDATTQQTTRVLETRASGGDLRIDGSVLTWDLDGIQGIVGFYDLTRHELRLVQRRSGSVPVTPGVFGDWFVWAEIPDPPPTIPGGPRGGIPVGPGFTLYAVKIRS